MLRNYLITALRNLRRESASTLINIVGLTLGVASSLVLFLLIRHQTSYDTYHQNRERIYRVVTETDGNDGMNYSEGVPAVLPEAFKNDFPEAEEVTFTSYRSDALITIPHVQGESKKYEEEKGVTFAQPSFFKIFDRNILAGSAEKGLDEPNEAIISTKLALKYFGKEDVLGEVVKFDNQEYQIKAVMEDCPPNTDLPFELMLSAITIQRKSDEQGWGSIWSDEHCYFTLKSGATVADINKRMPEFLKKYHNEDNSPRHRNYLMQHLRDLHFEERFGNYNYNTVSRPTLIALSVIAVFLVLTACINFVNLTTAEAIKRSKEVGIRKALGSSRTQLIRQFLGETSLVAVLAVGVAVGMAKLALGFLNPFLELSIAMNFTTDSTLWIFLFAITVLVALLSGLYPSLVVSGYKPVLALKNQMTHAGSSGYTLRRSLVVLQFFISQFFIIGTIVLIDQMDYFRNKDLGFRKDAIVSIPVPENEIPAEGNTASKMRTLREEVNRIPGVELASLCSRPPSSGSSSNTNFTIEGNEQRYRTQLKLMDANYLELFGLNLLSGSNVLDLDTAQGFIVNERLAAITGHTNSGEIIGKKLKLGGKDLPVIGVVKDFHTVSLRDQIEPTAMFNRIRSYETLSVRINPVNMQETLKQVQEKWERAYPDFIFSYEFLDDQIKEFYESEQKMSVLLSLFTSLAIFIGCLGLFGLATFMANQKTKEIGVRKVLGASVESIVILFSKEYIKLIIIGFAFAAPLAWYIMNQWLNEFAYKIELGPFVFISGLGITLAIALLTVGYRSLKAAIVNPAKSLRSE